MLKLNQEGSDNERIALLQSLLEDANSRKNELETENRWVPGSKPVPGPGTGPHGGHVAHWCSVSSLRLVNQRLLEGQSQVEELQKALQEQGSAASNVSV